MDKRVISILQWNVYYREDIRHIAEFLREHPADVVCLQELTLGFAAQAVPDTPAYIAEQLGFQYYAKAIPLDGSMQLADAVFSRWPIVARHTAWINQPTGAGGYSDEHRAYAEVTLDLGTAEKLHVGTVHMSYTHAFEPTPGKAAETQRLIAQIQRHSDRLILTGDFNATPGSPTITALSEHLRSAGPDHARPTWTTKPFSYNGFEETELRWRLDYIFTTPDLVPASAEILQAPYSDHLPILAHIKV